MSYRQRKRRLSKALTSRAINPVVRRLLQWGVPGTGTALLETTGRHSGKPRRVPVGNGLRGRHFWIVTEHGWSADYVKNIQRDPRVRVKVGRRWLRGTAQILPEEDPRELMRRLRRPANDAMVRLVGTEQLVIRVDLDSPARAAGAGNHLQSP
ncbi:MAG: nitroreductase family deazaflavin-dependent oxidoreductase [Solirubrobacterales bacterium]|nr:nitroreductase family deazaflavin-dependent oxidoreductase [Solirubrobacterales bacterium]